MHHKICHVLGGAYNLPHAQTHAIILPHVLAYNAPSAPDAESRIAAAFGAARALDGLNALRKTLDAPRALKDYGLAEENIPEAARLILPAIPDSNPRKSPWTTFRNSFATRTQELPQNRLPDDHETLYKSAEALPFLPRERQVTRSFGGSELRQRQRQATLPRSCSGPHPGECGDCKVLVLVPQTNIRNSAFVRRANRRV